jgi:hypothetical protein
MTWQIFIEHHQVPQGTGSEIRDQNQTTPDQTRPSRNKTPYAPPHVYQTEKISSKKVDRNPQIPTKP